jgi:Fe-S-cluster containining protein
MSTTLGAASHPCRTCGACCASFRVSFYWGEQVPEALTQRLTPLMVAMRGTNQPAPRCVALDGAIGGTSTCTIYGERPSPCRDFGASLEFGEPNERCDAARLRHGLPALTAADWIPSIAPSADPPSRPSRPRRPRSAA